MTATNQTGTATPEPIDLDALRAELDATRKTSPLVAWADGVACDHGRVRRDCEWCNPTTAFPETVTPTTAGTAPSGARYSLIEAGSAYAALARKGESNLTEAMLTRNATEAVQRHAAEAGLSLVDAMKEASTWAMDNLLASDATPAERP